MAGGVPLLAAGVALSDDAPEPILVRPATSTFNAPRNLADAGGTLYFSARGDSGGNELWKSDGTGGGTVSVRSFGATGSTTPRFFTEVGGVVYFQMSAGGTGEGVELWRSDGTAAGTALVRDIWPTSGNSNPSELTRVGSTLYFKADDGVRGRELWKSDGTAAGTVLVRDIHPTDHSEPGGLTSFNGRLYFRADDGMHGEELWTSDGTEGGTHLVLDAAGGGANFTPTSGRPAPTRFPVFAGALYFVRQGNGSRELWTSDGTAAGTARHLGSSGETISGAVWLEVASGALFFRRGLDLYKTDGSSVGTVLVKDSPVLIGDFTRVGSRLHFLSGYGSSGSTAEQLWTSDGTTAGTTLLRAGLEIWPGELVDVGGVLYFVVGASSTAKELWRSDGTATGTVRVAAYTGSSVALSDLTAVDGVLFYSTWVDGTGTLWRIGAAGPTTPPVVSLQTPAPGAVVGATSVDVTADVTHPAATTVTSVPPGVAASLPAGGGTSSGTVPLVSEGPNTITVSAADAFGNVGGTSVEVIRDTTAPGVTVTSPTAWAVVGVSPVDVTVEVADLTATTLDVGGGGAVLPTGVGSVTVSVALVAGPNDVPITVTDAAGNPTSLTHAIVLDLDAPVVTIEAPLDGQRFGPGASPVAVVARVDDLSATTVSSTPAGVSEGLPAGGGVVAGAVLLVEGSNTITLTATDAAGRMSSDAVTVVHDTTPPAISFASPADGDPVRGTIDVHLAASDPLPGSGVASVAVTLDGDPLVVLPAAPFETMLDTTAFGDGPHVLSAIATDGLGNASAAVSVTLLVDNTPPIVTIVIPANGAVASGLVPIEVSAADATSGLVAAGMAVAGVAPTTDGSMTYAAPVAADTLLGSEASGRWPDGPTPFAASARDAAGNVAAATSTVELDNTNPASALVRPHDGDVVSGTLTIEASAADPNLASLTLLVDGVEVATSATSPLVHPFDTTSRLDGAMSVELRVTDTVGNASASTARVTVDNVGFTLSPTLIHLKSKGGVGSPADAELTGPNLALLLPTESHAVELRIPGGNAVPAEQGWDGDDELAGPGLTRLRLRFSRAALVASIQAGIAGGHIDAASRQAVVTLVADGLVQGTTVLRFAEGK